MSALTPSARKRKKRSAHEHIWAARNALFANFDALKLREKDGLTQAEENELREAVYAISRLGELLETI